MKLLRLGFLLRGRANVGEDDFLVEPAVEVDHFAAGGAKWAAGQFFRFQNHRQLATRGTFEFDTRGHHSFTFQPLGNVLFWRHGYAFGETQPANHL